MSGSRDLKVVILGDSKGAEKAFQAVGDAGDKVGKRLAEFGKKAAVAGVAVTAGVAALSNEVLNTGAKLAAWRQKTAVVFEGQAASVRKWAAGAAASFGLTDDELAGLAAGFGDLLKPMGFTADQAADMSKKVVGLSGALSSWSGGTKGAAEVSDILAKAMLGERDGLKALGISISDADVQGRLAAKGQKDLTGAALEQAKALATQELIFEKSTDAQKAWAEGGNKALAASNKLKAGFAEFREQIADKLLPVVLKVATWLGDRLPAVMAKASEVMTRLSDVVKSSVIPPLMRVAAFVQTNLAPILAALGGAVLAKLGVELFSLGSKIVGFVRKLSTIQGAIAALGGPVTLIIVGVAALAGAAVYAYKNFEGFRNVVDGVARFLRDTVLPAIAEVGRYLVEQFGRAVEWVKKIWPQISEAVSHVMNVVQGVVQGVLGFIQGLWAIVGDDILRVTSRVFNAVSGVISGVMQIIRGVIQTVLAIINGDWGKAWDGIKGILAGVWNAIYAVISGALGVVKSILGAGLGVIGTIWSAAWDGIKGAFGAVWDGIKSIAVSAVNFMTQNVINPLIRGLNTLITGFNRLPGVPNLPHIAEIARIASGSRGADTSVSLGGGGSIRAMAEGGSGTVSKPTLFLAGEAGTEDYQFVPHSKGGLGGAVVIHTHVYLDKREIAIAVTETQRQLARAQR